MAGPFGSNPITAGRLLQPRMAQLLLDRTRGGPRDSSIARFVAAPSSAGTVGKVHGEPDLPATSTAAPKRVRRLLWRHARTMAEVPGASRAAAYARMASSALRMADFEAATCNRPMAGDCPATQASDCLLLAMVAQANRRLATSVLEQNPISRSHLPCCEACHARQGEIATAILTVRPGLLRSSPIT